MANAELPDFSVEVKNLQDASAVVKIKANKDFFARAVNRTKPYKALPAMFRPVLEKIADYVRITLIPETFEREGPGWHPLARRTVAERIQAGFGGKHPILVRSGDLFKELTDRSHPKHIEVIRTGKNARLEMGGSSEKYIQNQLGVTSQRLPARPMIPGTGNLPLPDRDRIAMKAIAERAIKERLEMR